MEKLEVKSVAGSVADHKTDPRDFRSVQPCVRLYSPSQASTCPSENTSSANSGHFHRMPARLSDQREADTSCNDRQ